MTLYRGVVKDGKIELLDNVTDLPDGTPVRVEIMSDDEATGLTGKQILESGLVGLWKDRDDIEDTAEFAEQLRRRASTRKIDED